MLSDHFDDAMLWTWMTILKKRLDKAFWYEVYGDLLEAFCSAHADFKLLCNKSDSWAGVSAELQRCTQWRFGKKMFTNLIGYVTAARVKKAVDEVLDKWKADKVAVTLELYEAAVQKVADEAV